MDVLENTITPELALAAAAVLKKFCEEQHFCEGCVLDKCKVCDEQVPKNWEIPERGKNG